jgi:hypothetical protein
MVGVPTHATPTSSSHRSRELPELRRGRRPHQENLGRRGKGEEARALTGDQPPEEDLFGTVVICSSFPAVVSFPRRRRLPSPSVACSLRFHEQKHGGTLVGEDTRG